MKTEQEKEEGHVCFSRDLGKVDVRNEKVFEGSSPLSSGKGSLGKRQLSLDDMFSKRKTTASEISSGRKVDWVCEGCINPCEYCKLEEKIDPKWRVYLKSEFGKDYFRGIKRFLHKNKNHLPPIDKIFTFSKFFPLENTKVVIMGQDPYHNDQQAMGLSFSVPLGVSIPPSLRNIYLEASTDIEGFEIPSHGDLTKWAENGVLLLNDVLTVTKNQANSHAGIGWREFTSRILQIINEKCTNVVFMLWGRHAQAKGKFINKNKHLVLCCGHPSPLSSNHFFGCKHFSKANKYLREHGKSPIKWQI
ncbi:uracyl-DNA glycosylase [Encephalitozoon intestinalis ATCC 50506]|uniref:Uracil-DNA glycosylase n=1 Tax=Encephalitozoon intestinalis (strain ATCC 50506) TaxID=876142 RepID=E0S9I8_ENCIT|nr:uracyl-DNA glycosylase [Encephalitozoon intestinalis ATCC 50506]ADM12373.2 uracyl-DNA glycosylase [Encephalitozoon intestinalis ATCC 50506]UTX46205.1 uracyl-DNA glycosylase [Encephalitozoon intestinalis]